MILFPWSLESILSRKGLIRIVFVLLYCFPNTYMKSCSVFVRVYYLPKDCKTKTDRKCFLFLVITTAPGTWPNTVESGKDLVMNRMSEGPNSQVGFGRNGSHQLV